MLRQKKRDDRWIEAWMDLEKKLMIPESEILKCPDTKSNQNICKRKNI